MKLTVYSLIVLLLTACGVEQKSPSRPTNVIPQWYEYPEQTYNVSDITDTCTLTQVVGKITYTTYDSADDKLYVYLTQADCLAKTHIKCSLYFPSKDTCYLGGISTINGKEVAATYIRSSGGMLIVIPWLER